VIAEIEITNFKAFASATIRLGRYTLLSGLNSSGKSTVLQALALLRQAGADLQDFDDSGGLPLNGELVQLGTGRDVLNDDYQAEPDLPGQSGDREIGFRVRDHNAEEREWRFRYGPDDDFLPLTHCGPSSEEIADRGLGGDWFELFQGPFQYLRADRINPSVTFPRSYEMSVRRGFLGTRGEYAIDYLLHHQDDSVQSPALQYPGSSTRLLAQVEAWMGEICPGVRVQAAAIEQTDLARLGFQFAYSGQLVTNARRPTNVGFGLTYVLPVVIACLTSQPGALLLLENPEAHIHPQGQSAMARLTCAAAAAGAQVIVETHSDHILNGVRLSVKRGLLSAEEVMLQFFRRQDSGIGIVSPGIGPDGMLSQWPEGFFDEWDRSLAQLLDS
jgi:predicted ATPase